MSAAKRFKGCDSFLVKGGRSFCNADGEKKKQGKPASPELIGRRGGQVSAWEALRAPQTPGSVVLIIRRVGAASSQFVSVQEFPASLPEERIVPPLLDTRIFLHLCRVCR